MSAKKKTVPRQDSIQDSELPKKKGHKKETRPAGKRETGRTVIPGEKAETDTSSDSIAITAITAISAIADSSNVKESERKKGGTKVAQVTASDISAAQVTAKRHGSIQVILRLSPEMKQRLDEAAWANKKRVNQFVLDLLDKYI